MFPLRDQHVDINTQVSMRCEAGGVPRPTYSWFKDGQPLTSQPGDVEVTVNVVVIRHADPLRHSGMYECQASNMYGTRLSSAQLRILCELACEASRQVSPCKVCHLYLALCSKYMKSIRTRNYRFSKEKNKQPASQTERKKNHNLKIFPSPLTLRSKRLVSTNHLN